MISSLHLNGSVPGAGCRGCNIKFQDLPNPSASRTGYFHFRHNRGRMSGQQKNRPAKRNPGTEPGSKEPIDLSRVEFHRHGMALMPQPGDRGPGMALMVEDLEWKQVSRFCSCPVSKSRTCPHLMELSRIWKSFNQWGGVKSLWEDFRKSLWHRLAQILGEDSQGLLRNPLHLVAQSGGSLDKGL